WMLKECVVCVATWASLTRSSDVSSVTTASNTRIVATVIVNHRSRLRSASGAEQTKSKPPKTMVLLRNQPQNRTLVSLIGQKILVTRSSNMTMKRVIRKKESHPAVLLPLGQVLEGTSFSRMSCV
ncbi:hypothetical protein L1987_73173, partial [Smallanthus sonchifolius]